MSEKKKIHYSRLCLNNAPQVDSVYNKHLFPHSKEWSGEDSVVWRSIGFGEREGEKGGGQNNFKWSIIIEQVYHFYSGIHRRSVTG